MSETYESGHLGCDREFRGYVSAIQKSSVSALVEYAMENLAKLRETDLALYNQLTVGYRGWYFEDNWLDGVGGRNNSLVTNRMRVLKENIDKICKLYNLLCDNRSRSTLNAIIHNWLTFSPQKMLSVSNYLREAVDVEIFPIYEQEVFVDCGSFIGDTVMEYIEQANAQYHSIHTYDISASTVETMKKNLAALERITYNVKGVGESNEFLEFYGSEQPHEGNKLVKNGGNTTVKVPVVTLDSDIKEPITFLKIDVEGLDKEALRGARRQIVTNHPKLAVDSYHKLKDFFEIPLLIHEIDPSYHIYLRVANKIDRTLLFPRPSVYAL